jgi:hypothetical protein
MIIHQQLFSRFGFGILNNASKKMLELMEIYFDVNNKSKSGKWIPLDKDTALPHSSSNSINSQPCTLSCQLISTSNDQIQSKLDSLGLTLPQPLKALPNVKTPSAWIRIWKDKAYISGHGPQNPDGSIAGPFGYEVLDAMVKDVKDTEFTDKVKSILNEEREHLQQCIQLARQNIK